MSEPEKTYFAITGLGLESPLEDELKALGASSTTVSRGGVEFKGTKELLYRSLLSLRTAHRIFSQIRKSEVQDPEHLYEQAFKIDWAKLFSVKCTIAVDCVLSGRKIEGLDHSGFLTLKLKDAICDKFREQTGERPNVDKENPQIRIHLRFSGTKCTLSLDAAGKSLHERGYRTETLEAPLKETMAAGILSMSGWKPGIPLVDPMCGSGTMAIEAALWAKGIPAGSLAPEFSALHWADFDKDLWAKVLAEKNPSIPTPIFASDKQERAIVIAKANAKRAKILESIQFQTSAFETLEVPREKTGVLVLNPPYGERIGDRAGMGSLYSNIGKTLKRYPGWKAAILVTDPDFAKAIGLQSLRQIPIFNGPIECRLLLFNL
mgnify:CR=1 FL=1